MLFSSITFLYYFLPCVLFLYFIAPRFLKNSVLLLSSLFFYAWGEPIYVILMAASIVVGYGSGLLIEAVRPRGLRRLVLALAVTAHLGALAFFKYADFFIGNFSAATGLPIPLLQIALPIGISFYTFQIISYLVDVYRGDVAAQKNPIHFGAYVAMFPQLIAGPVVRYSQIAEELNHRRHSLEHFACGMRRFVFGLAKKVLIANNLGALCESFHASGDKSVLFYWLYAVAFALQIYFDFSGYSDMAIGLGRVFGFRFAENFNYPFVSRSITEFWRRWHISLGSWFRDYVYIPMGGSRVGKFRWLFNIFIVWMMTGFWHGAAWNFIVWGLFFAALLMIEKLFLHKFLSRTKVLSRLYVILALLVSFVVFSASDLPQGIAYVGGMFGGAGVPFVSGEFWYCLRSFAVVLVLAAVGSTPLLRVIVEKIKAKEAGTRVLNILEPFALAALLVIVTGYLVDGSFNPFLYFRF